MSLDTLLSTANVPSWFRFLYGGTGYDSRDNNIGELEIQNNSDKTFIEQYQDWYHNRGDYWADHVVIKQLINDENEESHTELNLYTYSSGNWQLLGGNSGGDASAITYLTKAPTADNIPGKLSYVMLDEEPEEKYEGYIYIINSDDGDGSGSASLDDLDLATDADIELLFGIMNLNNVQIEDTTLVVGNDVTIDEDYHLLNLDGDEYTPEE